LMTVPLSTYRAFTDRNRNSRIVAGIILLLTAAAISFTYSRAAFIAACVVILLVMRELRFNPIKIVVGALLVVVLLSPFLPKGYLDRLMTLNEISTEGDMQTEASFRGRASESMVAVQMFFDHPLLGVGASNYSLNYQDYSSRLGIDSRAEARKAHNSYLQIAAEKGFIGLGIYILMLIVLFTGLARARRQLRSIERTDLIPWVSAVQYSVASYLFTSLFLHDDYSRYLWMIVGLAAATTAMTESLVKQHNLSESKLSQRSGEVD
jgi:O-antigen ligase